MKKVIRKIGKFLEKIDPRMLPTGILPIINR